MCKTGGTDAERQMLLPSNTSAAASTYDEYTIIFEYSVVLLTSLAIDTCKSTLAEAHVGAGSQLFADSTIQTWGGIGVAWIFNCNRILEKGR